MDARILVGTVGGLHELGAPRGRALDQFAGRTVTTVARDGARVWAIVDGRSVWATDDTGQWKQQASIDGPPATSLVVTAAGILIGTEQAHLFTLTDGRLTSVESFEHVEGRQAWYTPWGDPADVRSIAVERHPAEGAALYVNAHVGGVVRSRDGGRSWTSMIDIETDVHQVLTHPTRRGWVLVASAEGLGMSRDGGDSWQFVTAGLHAHYLRAVAVSEDRVLVTASTGHRGKRSAVYRKPLDGPAEFERCGRGLPEWFHDNIDTACLAAAGPVVAFGTEDGRVFRSPDGGARWELAAKGLPAVRCVSVG
ncbi:MAG: WD40/YVTN/BNR-like repeat-containing protein [Candidatus Rokuibacteriota bacterium]